MKAQRVTGAIAVNRSGWHAIGVTRPDPVHHKIKQAVPFS